MMAVAMTVLLLAEFALFGWTAQRRFKLLLTGVGEDRFNQWFDRMAAPPGSRKPDLPGTLLVASIIALPLVGLVWFLPVLGTNPMDQTPYATLLALLVLAGGGGQFLFWALRAQMKMPKYALAGLAHYLIFTGFAVLLLRTIMLVGRAYVPGFSLFILDPRGPMPWALLGKGYSLAKDLVIGGVLTGLAVFIKFRLLDKSKRLAYGTTAWVVLGVIATMMSADLLYDGGEIAREAVEHTRLHGGDVAARANHLGMEDAAPLGWLVARVLLGIGITNEGALHVLAMAGYWIHVSLVWSFLNYLPYGKHFHVITALFNVLFRSMDPPGRLPMVAENSEKLGELVMAAAEPETADKTRVGVAKITDFSWKSILDFYTCTECGRCSDNCPAHRTGKLLSPKHFLLDLRNHTYDHQEELIGLAPAPKPVAKEGEETPTEVLGAKMPLVPNVIDPDVLWGCTTCRACEEQCPVLITYVDKIVDMRRNLVMVRNEMVPHDLQRIFQAIETNGNPWNLSRMDRAAWSDGLDVPLLRDKPDAELLYWVGCAASYDDSAKKIARSIVKILQAAKVDFAILGDEETCTGDPLRRAGNEYSYLMLAEQNVATLNGYKPKKILTTCPHCFNSLLNEYPQLGGHYEVVHHTDYLLELLVQKKIKPQRGVRAKVAYHDSCYLGRYNDVYESPREVLKRIPGVQLVEAEWNREKGLCCGAGGAQMWMEEQNNDRVNKRRTLQLLNTGATTVASACPFCHTMLSDGIKHFEDKGELSKPIEQLDIAVLLERSLALEEKTEESVPPTNESASAEAHA